MPARFASAEVLVRIGSTASGLQQLYFITDFALLLGIGGIYALSATRTGLVGAISLSVFLFGILLVRSPQVAFFGLQGYRAGAGLALIGVAALGAVTLTRSVLRIAPYLWFVALGAGLVGAVGIQPGLLAACSDILFALGCVAAGVETLRSRAP